MNILHLMTIVLAAAVGLVTLPTHMVEVVYASDFQSAPVATKSAIDHSSATNESSPCQKSLTSETITFLPAQTQPSPKEIQFLHDIFSAMAKNWRDGIGVRGFLGSYPEETPITAEVAEQYGIMGWTLFAYIQPSFEEAQQHAKQDYEIKADGQVGRKDSILQGIYFIGTPLEKVEDQASAKRSFFSLIKKGAYYFPDPNDTSKFVKLQPEYLQRFFEPSRDNPIWMTEDPRVGPKMVARGWTLPKIRGMISIPNFIGSSTHKKLSKDIARPLVLRGGFRVTFNKSWIGTLEKLRLQKRKYQNLTQNRYYDPLTPDGRSSTYHAMLGRLQRGSAYTVEVWSPEGELVAGTIVSRTGNMHSPDSVHYVEKLKILRSVTEKGQTITQEKTVHGVDLAKLAVVALIDRLHQSGLSYLDTQIVSHFTETLRGEYIPAETFLEQLNLLIHSEPILISFEDWSPASS